MAERPSVWVYDLQHLYSGLDFGEASVLMASPNRPKLYRKAERQFGADYHPPLLMTKGGLENPMIIAVDGKLLSFTERVGIYPIADDAGEDLISWSMKQRSLSEELKGRDFEIWAMKQYPNPNPQRRLRYVFREDFSPLFDPEIELRDVENGVKEVYQELAAYDKRLEKHKPIALGWYVRGGERFRIATRPYRIGELPHHRLTIATTLPVQPPQASTA